MLRRLPLLVLAFGVLVVLVSCAGRGGVSISVSPSEVTLVPGESVVFTATVLGAANKGVTWSSTGGQLVPSGMTAAFTAPAEAGEYEVRATSVGDRGRWASALVTVGLVSGNGVVGVSYDVPFGEAVLRFVGVESHEVEVSGVGVLDVELPAGRYSLSASAVESADELSGTVDVFVPSLSVGVLDVVAGGREELTLAYGLGAVRPDTWVRLDEGDVASIVAVSGDRIEFEDAPTSVLAMEVGDVLYLPPGVLPVDDVGEVSSSAVAALDEEPTCGVADEGSYVVFLGGGSEGRRSWVDYVPASLADLYVQVIDVRAWCSFSGAFGVTWPGRASFLSTQVRFDDVTVDVRLSGQEMFTNPLWPEEDLSWLVVQSAGCAADPTSVLCRKWFVVTELAVDITAESVGPVIGLSPSQSESFAWSKDLFPIPFGPLPMRANVGFDMALALEAGVFEFEWAGPLEVRYRYTNVIGDGVRGVGSGSEAFSFDPRLSVLRPDFGSGEWLDVSASVTGSLFVSVSDPARLAELYVRAGARAASTITVGDWYQSADVFPFSIDANWVFGAGYRDRFGGRFNTRGPTFSYLAEPPFYTFALSKLHLENVADLAEAFRVEYRRAGDGSWSDPYARGWEYGFLVPGLSYEVRLTSLGETEGVLASDCPGAASGTSITFDAPGAKQVCAVRVVADESGGTTSVSIDPVAVTLPVDGSQQFAATVTGASDTSVTWDASCGGISGSGNSITYTAPATVPQDDTCTLTATSDAAPTATATALVTVVENPSGPGPTIWTRQFGTGGADYARSVAADASQNVLVAGFTFGSLEAANGGGIDAFVRKYDANGTHLWTRQFGTAADEFARGVSTDANGNVFVAGETYGSLAGANAGNGDAFVRAYDPDGTHLWTRQFGTTGRDTASGVATNAVGSVFVAGTTSESLSGPAALGNAAFVRAYDASGNELWTEQYSSGVSQGALGVAAGAAGSVVIAGFVQTQIGELSSAFVSAYDADGNPAWARQFGTSVNDFAHGVAIDGAGDVIVVGDTAGSLEGTSVGGIDAFVRRYTSAGVEVSTAQFGSAGDDHGLAVALDGAGAVVVAGETSGALEGANAGGLDAYVRRFSP